MTSEGRRTREVLVGALGALLAFGAVPAVLVSLVGRPWPARWRSADVLSRHGLFDLLALLAWIAWATSVWPLLRSVVVRVRARDTASTDGARFTDRLALRIAVSVLSVAPVVVSAAGTVGGSPLRRPPATSAPARAPVSALIPRPSVLADGTTATSGPPGTSWTVTPGESLWTIAESVFGDSTKWQVIAAANLGATMDDGSVFVDPDLIRPGWILKIPTVSDPATTSASSTLPAPAQHQADINVDRSTRSTDQPDGQRLPREQQRPAAAGATQRARRGADGRPDPIPSMVAIGCGGLVAALLARRVRRARRLAAFVRKEGEVFAMPGPGAAELASTLDGLDHLPVLALVEQAWTALGDNAAVGGPAQSHEVLLAKAGPDGVEVRLSAPANDCPPGWVRVAPDAWFLPAASPRPKDRQGHGPWCPLLIPVGDNDEGSWLVPLSAGSCLPVLGAEAAAMIASMRTATASWAWHEDVVVTADPVVAAQSSRLAVQSGTGTKGTGTLFVGDPGDLDDDTRSRCAVLTSLALPGTAVTIVADAGAASIHPTGIVVRPHLLADTTIAALGELIDTRPAQLPAVRAISHEGDRPLPLRSSAPEVRVAVQRTPATPDDPPPSKPALDAAQAVVRLLASVPRIDGLAAPLDSKRARRAVELIAYLAVHAPEPVTGDRLRARVLGSADADAAAKTLFNTAGAARRALGNDPDAQPLLPPASRSGHYRISRRVCVDALVACDLIAAGLVATDADRAMALVREGLDQIEGEPLAGVLSGYAWWRGEGHERRFADLVVDGACHLVRLAIDAHHRDLARWAVERARLVEPYSEALARAAMAVAAASGDVRRLQREWDDCRRLVDDLDPGGAPSETTERLYEHLRRRLATGEAASVLA